MKNKFQQFALLTIITIGVLILFYWYVPQFIYVTMIVELFAFLTCGYLVFFDQRNTTSKFAWILTIILIPYIGLLCFL